MRTQIFKTTLIVLMVSLFGQFQVNGANVNPYSTPEYKVKSAESRVSKCKKEVIKQEKSVLLWEDRLDQAESRLTKETNRPIGPPLDAMGNPTTKAINKKSHINNARISLDSTKRSLRSSKEKLRADKKFLSNAEMELTKARARLVESEKKFSPAAIAERKAMEAEKTRKFYGFPRQTAQTNPQAAFIVAKLPFPFSSYDAWLKAGRPGYNKYNGEEWQRHLTAKGAWYVLVESHVDTQDRIATEGWDYAHGPDRVHRDIWAWHNSRPNGKKLAWTFGGSQRNLLQWKGQSAKKVFSVFGKPDKNNGFVRGTTADWDYYVMNIRDSINGLHTRVRFKMNNGVVQEIRLLD